MGDQFIAPVADVIPEMFYWTTMGLGLESMQSEASAVTGPSAVEGSD